MAENEWGNLEVSYVAKLRDVRVEPVPPEFVELAQRVLKGMPHPDGLTNDDGTPVLVHAGNYRAPTEAKAKAFAAHMRNAGLHTKPLSSVTVVIDPERTKVQDTNEDGSLKYTEAGKAVMVDGPAVDPKLVAFRVGARRGRAAAS